MSLTLALAEALCKRCSNVKFLFRCPGIRTSFWDTDLVNRCSKSQNRPEIDRLLPARTSCGRIRDNGSLLTKKGGSATAIAGLEPFCGCHKRSLVLIWGLQTYSSATGAIRGEH